jgi:ABC-type glutathione transport system ATPase component
MTEPILAAANVRVEFAGRGRRAASVAVDGVNLDIAPGEIVALVGESGCGKTTLARTMLGLERPTGGEVRFSGTALSYRIGGLKSYRRQVQLVLQDPTGSLNPRHTVYEAVAEGVRIHRLGNERQRVADALARCGLRPPERFFERYPHELSGGQRQRVVIAGALVLEPKVLVADEPVASLDASVRGEILSLLLKLRDELGLAALVVTNDLGLEHRRPAGCHVPGADRRGGHARAGVRRAPASVHQGADVGAARVTDRADRADRRATGRDQDPGWLPVPSALPGDRLWRRR